MRRGLPTGRRPADPSDLSEMKKQFEILRQEIEATAADALVMISSEHFGNFFNDNMPTYAIGMANYYEGPIEDPDWLGIPKVRIPGNQDLSRRLIQNILQDAEVSFFRRMEIRSRHDGAIASCLRRITTHRLFR